jgi:hypothetical protein
MQDLLISRMGKLTQKTVELTPENIELVADSSVVIAGICILFKIKPDFILSKDGKTIYASRETVAAAGNALKTSIQPAVPASPFAGIAG